MTYPDPDAYRSDALGCQFPRWASMHQGRVIPQRFGADPIPLCRYHAKSMADTAWLRVSQGLALLAVDRPTGDDEVFDYWPNALLVIQHLYSALNGEGRGKVPSYQIDHLYEVFPMDTAHNIAQALADFGWDLEIDEEEQAGSFGFWPDEHILLPDGTTMKELFDA